MQAATTSIGDIEPDFAPVRQQQPLFERRWVDLTVPLPQTVLAYDRSLQVRVDSHSLKLIRSGDRAAAHAMRDISLGLLGQHCDLHPRVFWQISAAYFEAVALGLTAVEAAGKKALTAILLQYRALAVGAGTVSENLLRDLLGLVAQASSVPAADAPVLAAVRLAYGLSEEGPSAAVQVTAAVGGAVDQASACERSGLEDQVKVVGTLHIDIASFNSYLNEADEWSRRLMVELSEWALELHRPVSADSIALARALAAGSERIGLVAVTQLADALVQALERMKTVAKGGPQQVSLLIEAADDIRRLLHQFAAGFLKSPEPNLLAQLVSLAELHASPVPGQPKHGPDLDQLSAFATSAQVTLLQLGGALRQWSARPDNVGARNEALRALQSLKEGAQQAGVTSVYELSCDLERRIEQLGMQLLQADQLAPLLAGFEALRAHLGSLQAAQA